MYEYRLMLTTGGPITEEAVYDDPATALKARDELQAELDRQCDEYNVTLPKGEEPLEGTVWIELEYRHNGTLQ